MPDADGQTPPRMPRWVRATLIVGGVLLVVLIALRITGLGGEHGPDRHFSGPGGSPVAEVVGVPEPDPTTTGTR